MAQREKHVFDTSEIPHLWAHKTQGDARNKQGNFYFEDGVIYSFGRHFPIARHITGSQGQPGVILTTRTYSSTTGGHVHAVRNAIPDTIPVFNANPGDYSHSEILSEYKKRLAGVIEDATAPRLRDATRAKHYDAAVAIVEEANRYAEFVGIKSRLSMPVSGDIEALKETARKTEAARVKAEREKRERERAEVQAYMEAHAAHFRRWRETGDDVYVHDGAQHWLRFPTEAMLRVIGNDEVVTSHGARVPMEHAERAYKIVAALRRAGKTYKRNGHSLHIGHYVIDSVDAEGTVKAGCHVILWAEIERLAAAQGWIADSATATEEARLGS